jgi:hypothetical protein
MRAQHRQLQVRPVDGVLWPKLAGEHLFEFGRPRAANWALAEVFSDTFVVPPQSATRHEEIGGLGLR